MSETTTNLVIFFILSIVILLFLLTSYNKLTKWLCFNNTFLCVKSKLEMAVECSYYRCKEGCNSDVIDKLRKEDFNCRDFCLKEWQDEEGKICNDNSFYHPVIVKNIKKYDYTESDFGSKCVLKIDSYKNTNLQDIINFAKALTIDEDKFFVHIEKSLLNDDKTNTESTCLNQILPVSFSRIKKFSFEKDNYEYFIFTKYTQLPNMVGKYSYATNVFILENICEACTDNDCCSKLIDYGIDCFFANGECFYNKGDCDSCGKNEDCCKKFSKDGKDCIFSGLKCYKKDELDEICKDKTQCSESHNDVECCNYLSITKKANCFYNSNDGSCLEEKEITCDDNKFNFGIHDICFYSSEYFCYLENKDLIASGCYNSHCYKICGSLVDIKSYKEEGNTFQSYFSDYKDCVFAINVFNEKYNSNIDYKVCCEKVKSCSDYKSRNLCEQNDCSVGDCHWNDTNGGCEDWSQ
ncbi:MAG: hypothetical protein KQA41_00275 [Candidatus Aenigmarchaeota archaeon]|nr:hypothetical protein [Candidatus Aenigmarchaeota archaeon]